MLAPPVVDELDAALLHQRREVVLLRRRRLPVPPLLEEGHLVPYEPAALQGVVREVTHHAVQDAGYVYTGERVDSFEPPDVGMRVGQQPQLGQGRRRGDRGQADESG